MRVHFWSMLRITGKACPYQETATDTVGDGDSIMISLILFSNVRKWVKPHWKSPFQVIVFSNKEKNTFLDMSFLYQYRWVSRFQLKYRKSTLPSCNSSQSWAAFPFDLFNVSIWYKLLESCAKPGQYTRSVMLIQHQRNRWVCFTWDVNSKTFERCAYFVCRKIVLYLILT